MRQAVSLVLAASPRPGDIQLGSGREGAIVRVPDFPELARAWCGGPAVARFDRIAKLEAEVARLRALLEAEGKIPPGG